jgi:hypothetical protein
MIENLHTIKGTLYAKECRKVKNKKKPTEPDWEFYSIKVEHKVLISGRTLTNIPEFSLEKGLSYDDFEVGDPIEIDFYMTGKKISDTWFKTEAKAVSIKPIEIDGVVRKARPPRDTIFIPPPIRTDDESNDDNNDDLPF